MPSPHSRTPTIRLSTDRSAGGGPKAPAGAFSSPVHTLSTQNSIDVTRMAQALNDSLAQTRGDEALVVPTAVEQLRLIQVQAQLDSLEKSAAALSPPEVLAEMGREVLSTLEGVVGEVTLDDVLDRVFSEFCIGK